jgi:adenosine deaminase
LMEYLSEKKIPLEVCPLSNVRTGVVSSIESHPVREFFERGMTVTINTDDPKMFGNSLAEEYSLLVDRLGFSKKEIGVLILQGIESSWLPDGEKQRLASEFQADENWLA